MKTLIRGLFLALTLVITSVAQAQDDNNPWVISFGVNAVDSYPTNAPTNQFGGETGNWFNEFYNTSHWNISPISTLGVSRYVADRFSLSSRFSFNQLTTFGDTSVQGTTFASLNLVARNSLAKKSSTWEPFTEVGANYNWLDDEQYFGFTVGGGLVYWKNDNLGISYQVNYNHSVESVTGLTNFQHYLGVNFKYGGVDTDGDGVYDKDDACPEVAGLEEFGGCPDSDGDGITDKEDACPNRAGSAEMNGCPDTDGDGLSDIEDACPNRAGTAQMGGCPDTDGDGVSDKDDTCPEEAGPAANNGCPWPDADGDGVADKDDSCPELAGVAANNGCPELPQDVIETMNTEGTMIRFKAESAEIIGADSAEVIQKIKGILESYPTATFVVEGHASSDGSKGYNLKLSESRAASVQAALIAAGADASRLSTASYGEEKPIGNNDTAIGRKVNRRVQFTVGKE